MKYVYELYHTRGRRGGVIVWYLDLQLLMQSVPITTNIVSSNFAHGKVYTKQHYVIKVVSDLRKVCFLFPDIPVSATYKTDRQDITEILLKMALHTITLTLISCELTLDHTQHIFYIHNSGTWLNINIC